MTYPVRSTSRDQLDRLYRCIIPNRLGLVIPRIGERWSFSWATRPLSWAQALPQALLAARPPLHTDGEETQLK